MQIKGQQTALMMRTYYNNFKSPIFPKVWALYGPVLHVDAKIQAKSTKMEKGEVEYKRETNANGERSQSRYHGKSPIVPIA